MVSVIRIDVGDRVICDLCGEEWTDRPESGGLFGLGSKAICPDCEQQTLADCERYGESHLIRQSCPEGKSFADWVRTDLRR